jgi:BrnA antitoxin of type II toxin-antitoxin system
MKDEYDFSKGKRGAITSVPKTKTRITIRLDDEIIDWFRSEVNAQGGGNYQSLINGALKRYIKEQQNQSLEEIIRKVVREEMRGAKSVRRTRELA